MTYGLGEEERGDNCGLEEAHTSLCPLPLTYVLHGDRPFYSRHPQTVRGSPIPPIVSKTLEPTLAALGLGSARVDLPSNLLVHWA